MVILMKSFKFGLDIMNLNKYYIRNNGHMKYTMGKDYNYIFDRKNGFFARWGATKEDNLQYSPIGPELLDIEVSTVCHRSCCWCYKSNNSIGKNMDFETFKKILEIVITNFNRFFNKDFFLTIPNTAIDSSDFLFFLRQIYLRFFFEFL